MAEKENKRHKSTIDKYFDRTAKAYKTARYSVWSAPCRTVCMGRIRSAARRYGWAWIRIAGSGPLPHVRCRSASTKADSK